MNVIAARARLDALIADVALAVRGPATDPRLVAEAMSAHCTDPTLLLGQSVPCCEERYVRHLLHEDAAGGWALAALVWRPGQMSPVHAHKAWCAVGFHRGVLAETFYALGASGVVPDTIVMRRPGDISFGTARPDAIHRLANLGTEVAISLHAYGLPYDRFCTDLNQIYGA
jgi:predicted metal-dependent enzyme (double-stranded beta helix superfamily)